MSNALKLVKGTSTVTKLHGTPARARTPRQQEVSANLALISRTWRTLTDSQRAGFTALGKVWSPTKGKSSAKGLTVFQALNGVLLNTGQGEIIRDAPVQPDYVGKLPTFVLSGVITSHLALSNGADSDPESGAGFALSFQSAPFNGSVQVLATPPLSSGVTLPDPKSFRQIDLLDGLSGQTTNLSQAYLAQFGAPALGMKVAIQLVPITQSGFRGSAFTQIATVTAAP